MIRLLTEHSFFPLRTVDVHGQLHCVYIVLLKFILFNSRSISEALSGGNSVDTRDPAAATEESTIICYSYGQ